MPQEKLKYQSYAIALQEVPGEISLAFNITGCPYACVGCHSPELQDYVGRHLSDDINEIIDQYKGLFSCVCFMGGDQNIGELQKIAAQCKTLGYKTCLYSGTSEKALLQSRYFDYVKLGCYEKALGGLDSPLSNQRMYRYSDGSWVDITHLFNRRYGIEDHP